MLCIHSFDGSGFVRLDPTGTRLKTGKGVVFASPAVVRFVEIAESEHNERTRWILLVGWFFISRAQIHSFIGLCV